MELNIIYLNYEPYEDTYFLKDKKNNKYYDNIDKIPNDYDLLFINDKYLNVNNFKQFEKLNSINPESCLMDSRTIKEKNKDINDHKINNTLHYTKLKYLDGFLILRNISFTINNFMWFSSEYHVLDIYSIYINVSIINEKNKNWSVMPFNNSDFGNYLNSIENELESVLPCIVITKTRNLYMAQAIDNYTIHKVTKLEEIKYYKLKTMSNLKEKFCENSLHIYLIDKRKYMTKRAIY
ncbi:hypothetical protein Hokovirus_1_275 [Hokovirus HKV1]|uniref:Uncharacterized protein n=1 Tax=Hokovirus HKV1 TaxID=1977638 RepID=A0A1V0SF95_9VIRU|nr:hypothetical protein Hokovirus_1_275 [Hokovirus HKV1]